MISVDGLYTGGRLKNMVWKNLKKIWYGSIHLYYGYCHTFDLSRMPELKNLTIGVTNRYNPGMKFKFENQSFSGPFVIYFHEPFGTTHK